MNTFEEKLYKHIDKVLEIQRNKETKPLTLEELKELDLSLGMTEEEWVALMKRADDNTSQAQSHLSYGNYVEAYKAADQAIAINPYHEQALLVLAKAALGKYEADDKDEFLEKARFHANELLKIAPNEHQAIEMLAKIRKYQKAESSEKKKIIRYSQIGLLVVVVIAAFFVFKPEVQSKENTEIKYQLIELEENANAAWAQVENVISRRDQMLPQILELAPNANSNNLKSEIETLSRKIEQSTDANEKVALQAQLQDKIKALLVILNKNEKDENLKVILIQIEGSFNRVSVEGKRYNEAVKSYNIMVKKHGSEFSDFKEKVYFKGK